MKFDTHKYWKHKLCLDVFFCVSTVNFDDDGKNSILHGTWCTQTPGYWFFVKGTRLKITPEEYDNWKPYTPKGNPKL